MAFVLNAYINIGSFTFKSVNDILIKQSVHSYVDTAEITLPTTAVLKKEGQQSVSELTAQKFKRGDKVQIALGYNGELRTEFIGFVNRIDIGTPLKIECEGYSYQLKKKNINYSWKTATLKEVCAHLVGGTDVKLHKDIPGMNLQNLRVVNQSATKVLDYIKNNLKLSVYFLNGNELYVGLEEIPAADKKVKYRMGWNVIDDGGLKFMEAEDRRIKVVLKTSNADGGKEVYSCGDADGDVKEHIVKNAPKDELKKIGDAYLAKLKYTGFDGKINTFLQPYAEITWAAAVEDKKYPERNGTYFIEGVEVSYGTGGARRTIEIGKKLNT